MSAASTAWQNSHMQEESKKEKSPEFKDAKTLPRDANLGVWLLITELIRATSTSFAGRGSGRCGRLSSMRVSKWGSYLGFDSDCAIPFVCSTQFHTSLDSCNIIKNDNDMTHEWKRYRQSVDSQTSRCRKVECGDTSIQNDENISTGALSTL